MREIVGSWTEIELETAAAGAGGFMAVMGQESQGTSHLALALGAAHIIHLFINKSQAWLVSGKFHNSLFISLNIHNYHFCTRSSPVSLGFIF